MSHKKKREPPQKWESISDHERFVRIFESMINSPAFKTLTPVATKIYFILKNEYRGNYTMNNVKCPYSTMIDNGISRNSIPPALRLLEALGFITIESGSIMRQPSVFHFSDKWKEIPDIETAKKIRSEVRDRINFEKGVRKELAEKYGDSNRHQ